MKRPIAILMLHFAFAGTTLFAQYEEPTPYPGPNDSPYIFPDLTPTCDGGCENICDLYPSSESVYFTVGLGNTWYAANNSFVRHEMSKRKPRFSGYNPPMVDPKPFSSSLSSELAKGLERPVIIGLVTDTITEATFTPAALKLYGGKAGNAWVKKDAAGAFRQILTNEYLTDITAPTADSVQIAVYLRSSIGALDTATGLYTIPPTVQTYRLITLSRPTATGLDTVDITSREYATPQSAPKIRGYRWVMTGSGPADDVSLSTCDRNPADPAAVVLSINSLDKTDLGNGLYQRVRTIRKADSNGNLVLESSTREKYYNFGEGIQRIVERAEAAGSPYERVTTWDYSGINGTGKVGPGGVVVIPKPDGGINNVTGARTLSMQRSDGYWEQLEYHYNSNTRTLVTRVWSTWKDSAFGDKINSRELTITLEDNERTVIERVAGHIVSSTRETLNIANGQVVLREVRQTGTGAPLISEYGFHSETLAEPLKGRIKFIRHSDGTLTRYDYAMVSGNLKTTIQRGVAGTAPYNPAATGAVPNLTAGTRVERTTNTFEKVIGETTKDIASGVTLSQMLATEVDAQGRPTRVIHNADANDYETFTYACCGLEHHRARDGTVTQYLKDALLRTVAVTTTTGARVVTRTYSYGGADGQPKTIVTTQANGVSGAIVQETVTDLLGRTVSSKSPGPMGTPETTEYSYSADELETTQTNPDGGQVVTTSHADGQIKSVTGPVPGEMTGSATIERHYTYSTHTENGGGETTTVIVANGIGGESTTYTDLAGRAYKQTRTAPHGQTAVTLTTFDSRGLPDVVTSSGQPAVKYLYNAEGEQIATWTDRNGDGQFNDTAVAGVKDSCTTTQTDYIPAASAPAGVGDSQRVITTVRTEANEDKIVSTTWQSVDGLRGRQQSLEADNPAQSARSLPFAESRNSTVVTPDGTMTVTTTQILANGDSQTTATFYSSPPSVHVVETNTRKFDALGRTVQTINGRGQVTLYSYHGAGGQLAGIAQVDAAPGGGNLVTSYTYTLTQGSGRSVTTTLPDNSEQYQETNLLRQTTRQWGSQTNPVTFTYDAAGRLATHTTFRNPVTTGAQQTIPSAGDITRWEYDPSGALLKKIYADNNKTTYTYDISGRLATRAWARGVVTVYSYTAGQVAGVEYFSSVSGWENYRNLRSLWQSMAADPANHTAQEISDAEAAMLAAKAAAVHVTTPAVTTTYDRLGRQTSSTSLLSSVLQSSISYSYDPATHALDTETVTIDPDGTGPLTSITRVLDRSTDTLGRQSGTTVSAVGSGTPEHFTNYGYDNSGRLSSVTSPAGSFSYAYLPNSNLIATVTGPVHVVTNTWEPRRDVLDVKDNRIPSTTTPISRFDYFVNAINQRTQVQTTGSAFPSQPADWNWGYDALGQVISADSPTSTFARAYEYDQIGNRKKSADGALVTTGSSATLYDANNLNQYSEIQNQQSSIVNPVHDADGNATSYPLPVAPTTNATLAYDGENRLISVITGTTAVSYIYDSYSRRVARTEGSNTTIYLYDGWNCLCEYALQNASFTHHTAHTWGLDLFGSLQGTGGVGGLLAVTRHEDQGATHFFATFDGNGNITEYLDAAGFIAAHYEYDPFGCTIVAAGPQAGSFEIRFSSKPQDEASGLHYYGYRWYDSNCGRWINSDPVAEAGGLNVYAFNRNDSLDGVDLLGMAKAKKSYNYHHWIPQEYAALQFTGEGLCSDVSADLFTTRYPGNFSKNFPHYFIHFKIPFGDWVNDFKSVYSKAVLGLSGAIKAIPGLTDKQRCCLFLAGIEGLMITSNTLVHAVFKGLKDLPGPGMPPLESYPWSFPNGPDAPPVRILNKKTDEEWQALIAEKCCDMPDIDLEKLPVWVRHPRVSPQPTSPQFTNFNPVLLPPMCLPGATHWPSAPTTTIEDLQSLGIGVGVGVAVGTGVGVGVAVGAAVGSVGALGWGAVGGTLVWATQ